MGGSLQGACLDRADQRQSIRSAENRRRLALAPSSCVALRRRPETNGRDGHGGALPLLGRDEDGGAAGGLGGALPLVGRDDDGGAAGGLGGAGPTVEALSASTSRGTGRASAGSPATSRSLERQKRYGFTLNDHAQPA